MLQPLPWLKGTYSLGAPLAFWPALLITIGEQAVLGMGFYVAIFRPLRRHRAAAKAVASIGLAAVVTAVVQHQVGTKELLANRIYPAHIYVFGHIRVQGDRLWLAITIVGLAAVLSGLYRLTRFGLAYAPRLKASSVPSSAVYHRM